MVGWFGVLFEGRREGMEMGWDGNWMKEIFLTRQDKVFVLSEYGGK